MWGPPRACPRPHVTPLRAQRAEDTKARLAGLADDLAMFPVVGGGSLEGWASRHVHAGIRLGKALAARAAAQAAADANTTAALPILRPQLLRTLSEYRVALTAEARRKPALAAAATRAFALFDQLSAERQAAGRASARKARTADGGEAPGA